MVAKRLRIADNKVGIWIDPSDDAPFTTPLSNLARVKFHSDLDYLPIVAIHDFSFTLPSIPSSGSGQGSGGRRGLRTALYTLGVHGMGFTPFCVGEIDILGETIAMCGSVPVAQTSGDRYARFLALGFDATNITAYEYSVQSGFADIQEWQSRPSVGINMRVYVSSVNLDSDNEPPAEESYLRIDNEKFQAGKFSSDNRYIREPADSDDAMMTMPIGRTLAISVSGNEANWRWQCGSVSRVGSDNGTSPPGSFGTSKRIAL
jgi:hypothetical protein